jgi:serine protease Do
MQETIMLDAIERYIRGEMLPEERVFFEELRKSNPAVDQMVVEHTLFLQEMSAYGEQKNFRAQLNEMHKGLVRAGEIKEVPPAKLVFLWKKYKRVVWVAASIAGITALFISSLITYVSPKVDDGKLQQLNRRITDQDKKLNYLNNRFNQGRPLPEDAHFTSGGTGFLIDAKGWLVTNAHVV